MKSLFVLSCVTALISCSLIARDTPSESSAPFVAPEYGSAAAYNPSNSLVYITGGKNDDDYFFLQTPHVEVSANLAVYNPVSGEFVSNTPGWAPMLSPRYSHVSVQYLGKIYVFGGTNSSEGSVEVYDPNTNQWSVATTSNDTQSRFGAASVLVGNTWYVFGGKLNDGTFTNELFSLNLDSLTWESLSTSGPSERSGASIVSSSGSLFAFGGIDSNGNPSSELWSYSISGNSWSKLWDQSSGTTGPDARFDHASYISGTEMYVTLGYSDEWRNIWSWSFGSSSWTLHAIEAHQISPSPKVGFASVSVGTTFIVFGGISPVSPVELGLLGDVWYLDTPTLSWTRHECFPGFAFSFPICVRSPGIATTPCAACKHCSDYSSVQRSYVNGIKNGEDTDGVLREGPACWRLDRLAQQK